MTSVKKPLFSVIVPAYNEEAFIADCLKSILNQDLDPNLYEVIVIDNASTDNTAAVIKEFKNVRFIPEPQKGVQFARQTAFEKAKGKFIASTDADSIVPKTWLSRFITVFGIDPNLDAIGGVFEFSDGSPFLKWLAKSTQKYTYHISGGNMAIKSKSLQKYGGFASNTSHGEDVLLSFKIEKEGKLIIDKQNIVATSSRRFSANFLKTIYHYFLNDLWLKLFKKPLFSGFEDIRIKPR